METSENGGWGSAMLTTLLTRLVALAATCLLGCGAEPPSAEVNGRRVARAEARPEETSPKHIAAASIEKIEAKHLPNAVRLHEKVLSGGAPEGDSAFAELRELGIQTVISVDGAKPDLATAQKFGMRYVHLPHGYDGIPEQVATELAKAVRDLPGGIYIHCHHGKHRSPAASAVACVGAGLITRLEAAKVLQIAGTSRDYRGLYRSVDQAQLFEKALLDQLQADFPASATLPAMAEAMVEIEHVHDRLKAIESAGWTTPVDHPDVVPHHEALLLREHFRELLRTDELKAKPEQFQRLTKESEAASQALEDALKSGVDPTAASKLFATISSNCKSCHQQFRDIPLGAK
jgi:hypothetical protein